MKQLGNQDAGFIYAESPSTPMHIGGLGIYDMSTAKDGILGHKDIIRYVMDRIHFAPIFRQKLVEVPFGLDKPYWIDDPDFNIEFHIRHIALPKPGDWRQLCILVSRLNALPLDFNRPLWEAYVIEGLDRIDGLPPGSFAILVKVHHATVDGASGQGIFGAFHDLSRDAPVVRRDQPLIADRVPDKLELLTRAIPNNISRPWQQGKAIYKKAPGMLNTALKAYQGKIDTGAKLKVPDTRFNKSLSPYRVFQGTQFSLRKIKAIKEAVGHGVTVNDVMLGVVGRAIHQYLNSKHEGPDASLAAILPQDIRSRESHSEFGSQVGGLFADLASDVADPIERLRKIHSNTLAAKDFAQQVNTSALIQNFMGGFLNANLGKGLNRMLRRSRLLERMGSYAANTLITNVPGPQFPLYHAGAELVAYWTLPPVMDCIGLSHAVFSYQDHVSLSVSACREQLPDPQFYIQCCEDAYTEIEQAALNSAGTTAATGRTASKTTKAQPANIDADGVTSAPAADKQAQTVPGDTEKAAKPARTDQGGDAEAMSKRKRNKATVAKSVQQAQPSTLQEIKPPEHDPPKADLQGTASATKRQA